MSATRYADLPSPFRMKRGGTLVGARIAYETWGTLAPERDNAVLILTGLSPSAHAASNEADPSPGWWEDVVGPAKPIDTNRWFVVCVNSLGSCKGSTGPASSDPLTGAPYRMRFPDLTLEDVAQGAKHVLDALGVAQLKCLVGPSMGGMSAQAFALLHPGMVANAMLISTSPQALPFSIGIRSLQREAILRDPNFNGGEYTDETLPRDGLALARKLGVVTYRSALEWKQRFGRARVDPPPQQPFGREFQIESYLEGHAKRFVGSFDPCSYIYLSRAMDWFDLADYGGTVEAGLARMAIRRALVIGVETDILFPLEQQEQIAEGLRTAGAAVEFAALSSIQGHDAFLVDFRHFNPPIARFMASLH
ncbi:MAG TPA: homoserine O-acetyltransferase [Xanthomonadales bacterium]|nr:homoserine O-acetyltransferase [Xanthomonadales bacterium]